MASRVPEPYCTTCGHNPYADDRNITPACGCQCHTLRVGAGTGSQIQCIDLSHLREGLNELDHLRTFRNHLQAENSRVTEENRKLSKYLDEIKDLCLLFLGQHLWSAKLLSKETTACLCSVCDQARHTYEMISGTRPSSAQEIEWMRKFVNGGK